MVLKKWQVPQLNKPLASDLAEECGIDPFIALILTARGLCDPMEIEEFLSEDAPIGDPFELKDLYQAVERIRSAIENFEKIVVFGDYDCDGVTATALLYSCLSELGADVLYHVPQRSDGYGLSKQAVDELHAAGVDLVVTVDNGVSANAEIDYAASLGMQVVVTDHHLPNAELPAATAVVNPHRADCPSGYKDLAGVGVAFKLACALEGKQPEELFWKYGDLAALGTIADVMPLTGENRTLVQNGLRVIARGRRPGLAALLKAAGGAEKPVTATTAAFILAPRINAAGRMGNSERAVQLLLETDPAEADARAAAICEDNAARQTTEREIAESAVAAVYENHMQYDRVLVISGEGWHHGVVGIAASRLVERFGRPVIMLSDDGQTASGSGRSIAGFNLFEAVQSCENLLLRYGGHTLAAGMTLKSGDTDAFRREINRFAAAKYPEMPFPVLRLDCKLNPAALSVDLARTLEILAPFGSGNPLPVFGIFGLKIENIQGLGGDKHTKLYLSRGGAVICGLLFGTALGDFPYEKGETVNIAAVLEVNEWQGEQNLSIRIKDIHPAALEEEDFTSVRRYECFQREECDLLKSEDMMITREEAAAVFRAFKRAKNGQMRTDDLFVRLCGTLPPAKIQIAADVFEELGILQKSGDRYAVNPAALKVNLDSSAILEKIKKI